MSGETGAAGAALYEWRATEGGGIDPRNGRPYRDSVIRYRRQGAEDWHLFVLTWAGQQAPTETQVLRAIEERESVRPRSLR